MIFEISGHSNILGTHRNTIEFTKDAVLSKKGDCIIGVCADFDASELKKIAKEFHKIMISLRLDGLSEVIEAIPNKEFDDSHEIVIRRSEFPSKRTLGFRADKSAIDLDRKLIERLKDPSARAQVEIRGI